MELYVCYNAWPPKPNSTTIKYLVDCEQDTGYHEIYWNCKDKFGSDLPSGYYGIGLSFQIEGYASGVYGGSVQIIR